MNHISQFMHQKLSHKNTGFSAVSVAVLLSACGGGGSGGQAAPPASGGPTPILAVGMQRQYQGVVTRSIVYTNPTAGNQNNTLAYTYTEKQNVLQAPANAPGNFDINSVYTYQFKENSRK